MPKWRPFTWVIVGINVLFLVWIIATIAGLNHECATDVGYATDACGTGTVRIDGVVTIGVGIIVFLWVFVDIILGIIWLVTGQRGDLARSAERKSERA